MSVPPCPGFSSSTSFNATTYLLQSLANASGSSNGSGSGTGSGTNSQNGGTEQSVGMVIDGVLMGFVDDIGGDISMSRDGYVMSAADWNCWDLHWSAQTCAKGYLRETRRKDGGVMLIHCIYAQAAPLLEAVLPALIEEGYTFVRLDQMPEYRQYETPESGSAVAEATPLPKSRMIRVSALK